MLQISVSLKIPWLKLPTAKTKNCSSLITREHSQHSIWFLTNSEKVTVTTLYQAVKILKELKLLNQHFINEIVAKIKSFPTISSPNNSQQIFLSKETNTLFELAFKEAEVLKDEFVGIECILIGMTKLENSFIQQLFRQQGVNSNSVLNAFNNHDLLGDFRKSNDISKIKN